MNFPRIFKILAVISYCLIWLQGWFIGGFFICYLFFSLLDERSPQQFAAIISWIGLTYLIILTLTGNRKNYIQKQILIFFLLSVPLIERLINVPIYLFNYKAFIVPAVAFFAFYAFSILLTCKGLDREKVREQSHFEN